MIERSSLDAGGCQSIGRDMHVTQCGNVSYSL